MQLPCRREGLGGLDDAALLNAGRTHAHAMDPPIDQRPDAPEVREPAAPCLIVGMADIVAAERLFSAHITYFCH